MINTMWEDDQYVGFACPNCKKALTIGVGETTACVCGKVFELHWNVEVKEVSPEKKESI